VLEVFFNNASYLGIVLVLVISGCGLPLPEELTVVLAGVLSSQGSLDAWWALVACLVGAVLGDSVVYAIGYHYGHGLLSEHPRFARFLRADREPRFEQAIERHALKVLVLSRFMVGIRAPVYLAAGIIRMPFRRFLMYDLLAATLVVCTFFGLSYAYGESVVRFIRSAEWTLTIAAASGLALLIVYFYRYQRERLNKVLYGNADDLEIALFGTSSDSRKDSDGKVRQDQEIQPREEKRVG
jgi:membrane protein DedA with SNARE-associated domain